MNHQIGRYIFGFGVGLLLAFFAYRWIVDPDPRVERLQQEAAVIAGRQLLHDTLNVGQIEIVDTLAPLRKVGKSYVFRVDDGWEVSGYYRRGPNDLWHPFLLTLDDSLLLLHLKVSDSALLSRASKHPNLEVLP